MTQLQSPAPALPVAPGNFRQETASILAHLRTTIMAVVNLCLPADVRKSRDIQKRLGLDVKLGWQLFRIVNSDDPLTCYEHVPSPASMRKFLGAARDCGTTEALLAAVADSFASYEQHVEKHAGNHAAFEGLMARMLGGEAAEHLEFAHRKNIFEGNSFIWGVSVDTGLITNILHPSLTVPGEFECGVLRIKRGLRRLCFDTPLNVDRRRIDTVSNPDNPERSIPLDKAAFEKHGFPILPDYCSTTALDFQTRTGPNGRIMTDWAGDAVGRPSDIDLAFGEVLQGVVFHEIKPGQLGFLAPTAFITPSRSTLLDLLIHRPTFGTIEPEITRWGHAGRLPLFLHPVEAIDLPRLACREKVAFLGSGAAAAYCGDVPQYVDILRYTCEKQKWNIEDMDLYRVRIEYPLMDTMIRISYNFPADDRFPRAKVTGDAGTK